MNGESVWERLRLGADDADELWELFHENTKNGRFDSSLTDAEAARRTRRYAGARPFADRAALDLPPSLALPLALDAVLGMRRTPLAMAPAALNLAQLATILRYAYGITAPDVDRRAVPSAGALYPLELYVAARTVDELPSGLHFFDPRRDGLVALQTATQLLPLARAMLQAEVVDRSAAVILITANFERTTFKYRGRGYRYALIEAGHVAQNIDLTAAGLGLAATNIGGFFDRDVDALLGLDGIAQSALYLVALGGIVPA